MIDSAPISLTRISHSDIQLEPEPIDSDAATSIVTTSALAVEKPSKSESVFVTFGTTFVTIFLAEIGDKTQLSTLLMSAESHAPWVVFLGSAAALITTSFLGVVLGSWISTKLSPKTVEKSAGVMLLLISVMLFWDVFVG